MGTPELPASYFCSMQNNPPKILHITKWFPAPSDEQLGIFVEKHIRATLDRYDVRVLHLAPSNIQEIKVVHFEKSGLQISRIEFPEDKNVFFKLCFLSAAIKRTCEEICQNWGTPDIIHAHLLAQPVLVARKNFPNTPIVTSEHWTGFVNGYFDQLPLWKKKLFKKAVGWSHTVTTPSISLQEALVQVHGFKGNFQVVPNVIASLEVPPMRAPNEVFTFLTVADLHDHNKNVSGALRSFSALDRDFRYEIIGDGSDRESLKNLCSELGLDGRVTFLGRKNNDEVLEHLHRVDTLLVNSNFETFSMITAEALVAGLPVIATRCGGPEQFVHQKNGVLIEKENEVALKDAILHMLEHGGDYDKNTIREEFKEKFSEEAVGIRFHYIYQSALGKAP